jgi:hypothetical protein
MKKMKDKNSEDMLEAVPPLPIVSLEQCEAFKEQMREAMKKVDARFTALLELFAMKGILLPNDIDVLKKKLVPKHLAAFDQDVARIKEDLRGDKKE